MKEYDMRFAPDIFKKLIGKRFEKYRCDSFEYRNSVTQIVGFYIDGNSYKLTNIQEVVDYFGTHEDMSVCRFTECDSSEIKSAFVEEEMVDTPINGIITKIRLINENQRVYENGKQTYNVWLSRGIIFDVDDREISFEKDNLPFSEEIIIQRGYNLISTYSDPADFSEDWDDGISAIAVREILTIE